MTSCGASPGGETGALDLSALPSENLEEILFDLLVVKYPGIEQEDVARFLEAMQSGDVEQVSRVEADLAVKSAQWKLAALDLQE
jgi:hypothetical protein